MANDGCKCRACGEELVGEKQAVRVQVGEVTYVDDDGAVDFDDRETWGFIHLRCFLLAIDDPEGVRMMMEQGP